MVAPPDRNLIAFTVPGRPTAWKRPAQRRDGGRFDDPRQVKLKKTIAMLARHAAPEHWPIGLPMELWILFCFRHPKSAPQRQRPFTARPDLDNLTKLIKDALGGVAWNDDAQVVVMHMLKTYDSENLTRIEVRPAKLTGGGGWIPCL